MLVIFFFEQIFYLIFNFYLDSYTSQFGSYTLWFALVYKSRVLHLSLCISHVSTCHLVLIKKNKFCFLFLDLFFYSIFSNYFLESFGEIQSCVA